MFNQFFLGFISPEKEMKKIEEVIRKRKFRTLLSEKEKNIVRMNSRIAMALCRKNGSLSAYKQRKKRDPIDVNVWRNFFKNDIFVDLFMETNLFVYIFITQM